MKMRRMIAGLLAVVVLLALTSCGAGVEKAREVRTGDLVFVGIPVDYGEGADSMSEAIGAATAGDNEMNIIHVAILEVQNDSIWIIDATIKHNVDRYPLDTFLRDFTLKDGSYPQFEVKRLKGCSSRDAARYVENAKQFIGEPYDVAFLPDNGAKYCSELVRDSYLCKDGTHIFGESPMNFLDSDGQMPAYWTKLFGSLGMPVPQGVRGTNPQAMSKEDVLETVSTGEFWHIP